MSVENIIVVSLIASLKMEGILGLKGLKSQGPQHRLSLMYRDTTNFWYRLYGITYNSYVYYLLGVHNHVTFYQAL